MPAPFLHDKEMLLPRIPWRGKAAAKGYWEGHGKKRTENTEKSLPCSPCQIPWQRIFASWKRIGLLVARIHTKIGEIRGQVFSVSTVALFRSSAAPGIVGIANHGSITILD
jgi:hypothetical protein